MPWEMSFRKYIFKTPNFKSWKWFANSEFTRLFRPHLMMVWYGKSEENLFTVKWLLPHISQTSFSPPSFPTTPNLYFGKWKRKISKRQSLELLLRVNRHCNCRAILKMRIKVMHLLITLTQVETRRSSEYNQADNLLHLQVHPQQINPRTAPLQVCVSPGFGDIFTGSLMINFAQDLPEHTRTTCYISCISGKGKEHLRCFGNIPLTSLCTSNNMTESSQNQLEQRENRKEKPWPTEI